MAEYIIVSEESLRTFYDSIQAFKRNINLSLTQLQESSNRLRANLDPQTIVPVDIAMKDIAYILEQNEPTLEKLSKQVNTYADAVAKIKALQSR